MYRRLYANFQCALCRTSGDHRALLSARAKWLGKIAVHGNQRLRVKQVLLLEEFPVLVAISSDGKVVHLKEDEVASLEDVDPDTSKLVEATFVGIGALYAAAFASYFL